MPEVAVEINPYEGWVYQPPSGLSPSTLELYRQCPQKFFQEKILKKKTGTNIKAEMGTLGHAIMEDLMQLPPNERTRIKAKEIANARWKRIQELQPELYGMIDVADLDGKIATPAVIAAYVNKGIDGAFSMTPPRHIEVHSTEMYIEGHVGTVPMRGYVDLITWDGPRVALLDWKTGKAPWKSEDVEKKLTQVSVYCNLIEQAEDVEVSRGELHYVTFRKKFTIDWTDYARSHVVSEAEDVWSNILRDCRTGNFVPTPNFLCENPDRYWCEFRDICPAWNEEL